MIHKGEITKFETISYDVDLCVIGGGLAGMCAAISAARNGIKVLLMHDRPVLGGNASSEVRMWVRGAHGKDNRETGIVEEIALEAFYRNPYCNFSIWDSILYEKVRFEDNLTLLLNCSCIDAQMSDGRIVSVKGWQGTTQTFHEVNAKIFADCSGDSVLAPLTGAEYRMGRESADEFSEDIAPKESDNRTMGMSCLIQARQTDRAISYIPPKWAHKYTKKDFENKIDFSRRDAWTEDNFWWLELGGVYDSIRDTENLRDELLKVAFGVWDYIKNGGDLDAEKWDIEWVGFLPGKRESRRYVGNYIMTQNDVRAEGRFDDIIAYGGWSMDDHHPEGFATTQPPNIFHDAPSPFGIPYRCIYSKNIENLMFAGRNISTTHAAMSSTRVMATCALLGQALGTAASVAIKGGTLPGDVDVDLLQQTLMYDDCYLPFTKRKVSELTKSAIVSEKDEILRNGSDRGDDVWQCEKGECAVFSYDKPQFVRQMRIIFDSDLNRTACVGHRWNIEEFPMKCNTFTDDIPICPPKTLVKEFSVFADGKLIFSCGNNYQRMVKLDVDLSVKEIKVEFYGTWGDEKIRVYSIDLI